MVCFSCCDMGRWEEKKRASIFGCLSLLDALAALSSVMRDTQHELRNMSLMAERSPSTMFGKMWGGDVKMWNTLQINTIEREREREKEKEKERKVDFLCDHFEECASPAPFLLLLEEFFFLFWSGIFCSPFTPDLAHYTHLIYSSFWKPHFFRTALRVYVLLPFQVSVPLHLVTPSQTRVTSFMFLWPQGDGTRDHERRLTISGERRSEVKWCHIQWHHLWCKMVSWNTTSARSPRRRGRLRFGRVDDVREEGSTPGVCYSWTRTLSIGGSTPIRHPHMMNLFWKK